jgi:UDP-N-acetylglucosamine transferase subunit ALG13
MILVTTGTTARPFDRLLRQVAELEFDERVVVQHGASSVKPAKAVCLDYVSFDRFVELVREARVIVTHAGVGSILVTLMNGKRPCVVPRLAHFGEAVDDHQLELARRLTEMGIVTLVEDPGQLNDALRADVALHRFPLSDGTGGLVHELRAYLAAIVYGEGGDPANVA